MKKIRARLNCPRRAFAGFAALFIAMLIFAPTKAQTPAAQAPAQSTPTQSSGRVVTAPVPQSAAADDQPASPAAPSSTPSHQAVAPAISPTAPPQHSLAPTALPGASRAAESNSAPAPAAHQPAIGGDLLPRQLSYTRMFLDADWVVKAVMIGLAFASFVTWTVWLAKTWELTRARDDVRRSLCMLLDAPTLAYAHEQLRNSEAAAGQLMQVAAQEIRLSANGRGDGLKERISWQLERLEMGLSRRMSRGTGVLATIGSTAPFVGLFGTVWGIMNSFIGISNAHTTNLAVVAPGIAQALMATAMGLIAAIPAVMIYNVLARQTAQYRALLGDASAQVMRLVSRDLDRAKLPLAHAAE